MPKHGKRYRELYAKVDRERDYTPAEAVQLVKSLQSTKATETVEIHVRTGLNVRHAEEQLRGTITLPNSEGTDVTVAVFARGDQARDAEAAGADVVGDEDLAKKVEEGWTDFDVAIATPDMMPIVGRLGRVLGPQGKMPNPKIGTVTPDVGKAVSEAKAGKVEYRTDRSAIVHLAIGKTSLDERQLLENYAALIDELIRAKPAAAKGRYLRTITLATSQSPGIRVDTTRTRDILEEAIPASEAADANGSDGDSAAAEPPAEPAVEPAVEPAAAGSTETE
jgi:large subunit ribosomal protein L1